MSETRFKIELAMQFIPWLKIDAERIKEDLEKKSLTPLLISLSDFDMLGAIKIVDKLLEQTPGDISLRIQRVNLELINGDFEKADSMMAQLFSEPGADSSPIFFELWGLCNLHLQKVDVAVRNFKAGLAIENISNEMRASLANNLAWASMLAGNFAQALDVIEVGLQYAHNPSTLLLNKSNVIWNLGRYEEVLAIRSKLFATNPCDRRVFASLTLNEKTLEIMTQ